MRTVRPIALEFVGHLAAPADVVWTRVSTMEGVDAELRPWMTMTCRGRGSMMSRRREFDAGGGNVTPAQVGP